MPLVFVMLCLEMDKHFFYTIKFDETFSAKSPVDY